MIFVDTNVVIDLTDPDEKWHAWSVERLVDAVQAGPIVINAIVFAELSAHLPTLERVESLVAGLGLEVEPIPRDALFMAGQAFAEYRRAGGAKANVLPDFFIGAHASVLGVPLLTRDVRRYRTYFPMLQLVVPERD